MKKVKYSVLFGKVREKQSVYEAFYPLFVFFFENPWCEMKKPELVFSSIIEIYSTKLLLMYKVIRN